MWRASSLVMVVVLGLFPGSVNAGAAGCVITEGVGINEVRIGMPVQAALSITGPPTAQQTAGSEVTYALRGPWSQMVADYGMVARVSTRSPECRTARGVGTGAALATVRAAYSDATVSFSVPSPEGDVLTYPFVGIRFLTRDDRVVAAEVFRAEAAARGPSPASPRTPGSAQSPGGPATPAAQLPSIWIVRSLSTRVEETTPPVFVVEGKVENRGRPMLVFAEVQVFNKAGQRVGEGNVPVYPNPVLQGGDATFEIRIQINEVIQRYTLAIRPIGGPPTLLAERSGEITDLKPFTPVIAGQLQAKVQHPAGAQVPRQGFILVVTNGSSVTIAKVILTIEIEGHCERTETVGGVAQLVRWREQHTGAFTFLDLGPRATAQKAIELKSDGPCPFFGSWTAKTRVVDVEIGGQPR